MRNRERRRTDSTATASCHVFKRRVIFVVYSDFFGVFCLSVCGCPHRDRGGPGARGGLTENCDFGKSLPNEL